MPLKGGTNCQTFLDINKDISPRPIKLVHMASNAAGGMGLHIFYLAQFLDKEKFETSVILGPGYPLDKEFRKKGIRTFFVSMSRKISPIRNLIGLFQIYKILKTEKPDIVHTQTSIGGFSGRIAARLSRVPIIIFGIQGYGSHDYQHFFKKYSFLLIEKVVDKITYHNITVSKALKNTGIKRGIFIPKKVSVIYNGIDLDKFNKKLNVQEKKQQFNLELKFPIVGFIGRLEPQKGIEYFIGAASLINKSLPTVKFLIAGDGPLRKKMEKLVLRLGISSNTIFAGWRTDIPEILGIMDVFCLTSLWEGCPFVLLEAMAMRKPVVVTDIDVVSEIIKNEETGLVVPVREPEQIAHSCLRFLRNKNWALKIGEAARKTIEQRFTVDKMVEEHEKLYTKLYFEKYR